MKIFIKEFEQLSTQELFKILKLRTKIFVVEQNCAYQEVDDADLKSVHVFGKLKDGIIACARIVPPEAIYKEPSIGRVAVSKDFRNQNLGREIFQKSLEKAKEMYPNQTLKIQAQTYLEKWYKSSGFETVSEPYPDFGIMHVDMLFYSS